MLTRTILTVALAGFALTPVANADTYGHIDELAVQLERYAARLDKEFALHYRHTSQYSHLRSDSREMARLARHVHDVAHNHGSLAHLESDLRDLDRLFHHVEDLVDDIGFHADHNYHGGFGYHGGGHIHGETGHVHRLLHAMEDILHHLQSDVRELAQVSRAPRGPVVGYPGAGGYPSYGRYPSATYPSIPGPVIRFGRPGFSITLGR
jgi:hypothetical protein